MSEALADDEMSPKRIAADIAKELREHPERWFKGNMAGTADGRQLDGEADPGAVCWCLEGHINRRFRQNIMLDSPNWYHAREAAYEAFRKALGIRLLHQWNDAAERTVGDVIEVADKVAAS